MSATTTAITPDSDAWDNQRLARLLGYPYRDNRPIAARNLTISSGRSALLGALRLKDSAQVLGTVNPAVSGSRWWSPWGVGPGMAGMGNSLFMADHPLPHAGPGIRPDTGPLAGDGVDVQA